MLEQLLNDGWAYHDTESERLAGELEAAAQSRMASGLVAPFIALSTHTIGDHLQDWPRALALGHRVLEGNPADANIARACETLCVAAILAGDAIGAAALELAALGDARAPLVPLLSIRLRLADALASAGRLADAGKTYREAVDAVGRVDGVADLDRVLASASNNLAWTLHDLPSRAADEDALMLLAAETSLAAWRRCGDWINEELALSLRASVACAAGDAATALATASEGLAVIAAHGPRPLDAARLHLVRARAFALLGDGPARAEALAEADRVAETIASDGLKRQFAAERGRASTG